MNRSGLPIGRWFAGALVAAICALGSAQAESVAGVDLPSSVTLGSKTLSLNGVGIRAATFLKVKVYVMGLYLESKSADAGAIIASSEDKQIVMHFVHDVTADELRDGWKEGFENNYPKAAGIQDSIDAFQASMDDAKVGDVIELDFVGDQVDVKVRGAEKASIAGRDFQQAVLSIWLGPHPPNPELKAGILGGQ